MSFKNIATLTFVGALWLTVATLTMVVSPAALVAGFALPGLTQAAMAEVE